VGPVVAATLIGYAGDVARFRKCDHFAAYTGTAPIEVSSGGRISHRLSRRGNRQLNHALHIAAITQIRFPHSPGRPFFDRKVAEGKTKKPRGRLSRLRVGEFAKTMRAHRFGRGVAPPLTAHQWPPPSRARVLNDRES
jgi:transposase